MPRVSVDATKCQGHTLCVLAAPEVFVHHDEDGLTYVRYDTVEGQLVNLARRAAAGCPEEAIIVSND
jgi:ferredoxin